MKDMHELSVSLSPGSADEAEAPMICGTRVPTKEEIWATTKANPGAVRNDTKEIFKNLPTPNNPSGWIWLSETFSWD